MEPIVKFEDFLKTYPEKTQKRVMIYLRVMELRRKYGYGSKKIAKFLGISRNKIEGWLYGGNVPRPLKAIKFLEEIGLNLPLVASKKSTFIIFLKLLAFTFGDGGIASNFRPYFTGEEADLKILKKEIEDTFPCFRCKIIKIRSKDSKIGERVISGTSFILNIQGEGCYAFGRLLCAAGAPRGDKVIIPFLVPLWIMNGKKWVKKIFLNVLLGNELQAPKIDKTRSACFSSSRFVMVKTEEFLDIQMIFLNQIRKLLREFGIQTSKVKMEKPRKERKDGKNSYPMYFQIQKNRLNLYSFYKQFKLLYAQKKQRAFDDAVMIVRKSLVNELVKIRQYTEMQKLRRKGLGCRKVARYLGMPEKRSMIDGWMKRGQRPIYFNQRKKLEKILNTI